MWYLARPDAEAVLHDKQARRSLPRYLGLVERKGTAKFLIARRLPAEFSEEASTESLWRIHEEATKRYYDVEKEIDEGRIGLQDLSRDGKSYLDLKIELGRRVMTQCHFCQRRCGANRLEGGRGYCRCGPEMIVSTIFPHMGEEPELVPSGTVFSCGCTMCCIHCQNWEISQWKQPGGSFTPGRLASAVEDLHRNGCRNVNMVGGEPTPNLWFWLKTMNMVKANIPTVWNSNSYYSPEAARLLSGFIDVYLLDFKYGNNTCAEAISGAPGYWEACTRNHLDALRFGELIIRVLVLPEHNECCTRPILEWIAKNLGPWTRVNLMFQYRPEYRAHERKELQRRLTGQEEKEALRIAKEAGLLNLV
jgi:putative pyruvate formate lyase activating enzyme